MADSKEDDIDDVVEGEETEGAEGEEQEEAAGAEGEEAEGTEGEEQEEAAGAEGEEGKSATGEASQSRRDKRMAAILRERDEAKERAIRAETLAEERAKPKPAVSPEVAARQREEKLALMDPQERKDFLRDEEIAQLRFQGQLTQLQTADAIDKASYDNNARHDPIYAKYAAKVEQTLANMRANGQNPPRESVLDFVMGKAMREEAARKNSKTVAKKREAATTRVTSAEGRPTPGRGNVNNSRKGGGKESIADLEARLGDVVF